MNSDSSTYLYSHPWIYDIIETCGLVYSFLLVLIHVLLISIHYFGHALLYLFCQETCFSSLHFSPQGEGILI